MNDGSTVLDLEKFDDEMFYYVALDSPFIANSEKEWREHKWPKASYYIALENEAEELKVVKNRRKAQAFGLIASSKMSNEMKKKFCSVLELSSAFANLSDDQSYNLLYDYVENTTWSPGSNIDKFEELAELIKTATGREELEARFQLKRGLDSRVLYEKAGSYIWPRAKGQITLGDNYSEAINFFLSPKKVALQEELEEEITAKMGA